MNVFNTLSGALDSGTKILGSGVDALSASVNDVGSAMIGSDQEGAQAGGTGEERETDLSSLAELVRIQRRQIDENRAELHRRGIVMDVTRISVPEPETPTSFPETFSTPVQHRNRPLRTFKSSFAKAS